MSNNGLIGLPSGRNLMDAASTAIWCGLAVGSDVHYVAMPISPDSLQEGLTFSYVPTQTNPGGVGVLLNGTGPFPLLKQFRTDSAETLAPSGMVLAPGDIQPFREIECKLTISSSDPSDIRVLITSGVGLDDTNIGLDLRSAASQSVARSVLGLASGATTTVGTAATRNVGTALSNLVEVIDGSGDVNPALNIANRQLTNLLTVGISRTIWASIAFIGSTGSVVSSFNAAGVIRNGIGLYTVTFPLISGAYQAIPVMDVPVTASGTNVNIVSGSRTSGSVGISTMQGNSSVTAFDPDRVTVTIHLIS